MDKEELFSHWFVGTFVAFVCAITGFIDYKYIALPTILVPAVFVGSFLCYHLLEFAKRFSDRTRWRW